MPGHGAQAGFILFVLLSADRPLQNSCPGLHRAWHGQASSSVHRVQEAGGARGCGSKNVMTPSPWSQGWDSWQARPGTAKTIQSLGEPGMEQKVVCVECLSP